MTTVPMSYIKTANANAGYFWFTPDTMRFFSCRLPQVGYRTRAGDVLFWSSEKFRDEDPRRYSVRRMLPSGEIQTEGEFCAFETSQEARAEIQRILDREGKA